MPIGEAGYRHQLQGGPSVPAVCSVIDQMVTIRTKWLVCSPTMLSARLEMTLLAVKQIIEALGEPIADVFFPLGGIVSVHCALPEGTHRLSAGSL